MTSLRCGDIRSIWKPLSFFNFSSVFYFFYGMAVEDFVRIIVKNSGKKLDIKLDDLFDKETVDLYVVKVFFMFSG